MAEVAAQAKRLATRLRLDACGQPDIIPHANVEGAIMNWGRGNPYVQFQAIRALSPPSD
jgi:hypothetical protein